MGQTISILDGKNLNLKYDEIKFGHNLHNIKRVTKHQKNLNDSISTSHNKSQYDSIAIQKLLAFLEQFDPRLIFGNFKNIDRTLELKIIHNLIYILINALFPLSSHNMLTPPGYDSSNNIKPPDPKVSMCIENLPFDVGLAILSNLNATDLCLASCVWKSLAGSNYLWMKLCKKTWQYCEKYNNGPTSYKKLYMLLDEASLTFNADYTHGINYMIRHGIIENDNLSLIKFFGGTKILCRNQLGLFFNKKRDLFRLYIQNHACTSKSLSHSLRNLMRYVKPIIIIFDDMQQPIALIQNFVVQHPFHPQENFLKIFIEYFSCTFYDKYKMDIPDNFNSDAIFLVCFSLIMLSVDLYSPHVKNKMSKREFIKNIKHALDNNNNTNINNYNGAINNNNNSEIISNKQQNDTSSSFDDWLGDLYDDIYINGGLLF